MLLTTMDENLFRWNYWRER